MKGFSGLKGLSLQTQGSVTGSFLLSSRLNKDVLQSSRPLSAVSCHMQNTTFEHTSGCSYENFKDHLEILEILQAFSFQTVKGRRRLQLQRLCHKDELCIYLTQRCSKYWGMLSANAFTLVLGELINHQCQSPARLVLSDQQPTTET